MRRLWRGVLLLLLFSMAVPEATASGQVTPLAESDTLVLGRPKENAAPVDVGADPLPPVQPPGARSAQQVSSVAFVQVYTPFVWGRTSVGGLSVDLTLEDAAGNVKAVAFQTTSATTDNFVKVDRAQLYFETVFVNAATHAAVAILPGDRVRIVTRGVDPATGASATDDRRVIADDVRAWTSYERDVVEGTAPAGSTVIVTRSTTLALSGYITPGSSVTYQQTTAGADGRFQVAAFRTTADATAKKLDLDQGMSGFVRVRHADGSEVYTVHGQNAFVLQSSPVVHGYAFRLPTAPSGLEPGIVVNPRPAPTVTVTHKGPAGETKGSAIGILSGSTFDAGVAGTIAGGDSVEVSIWGAPPISVAVSPLEARVDLAGSQVSGSAPAGESLTVAAGRVDGYVTRSSTFRYVEKTIAVGDAGTYSSGQFQCGTSTYLSMHPGSFGYVGFEDARGNFVYKSFAAPSYEAMVDYPQVEGWISDAATAPSIAVRDASGTVKHQATAQPLLAYLTSQKLYSNVFFQTPTTAFISPGDTVTVSHPGRSATIGVGALAAYLDTDADAVAGEARPGQAVRVIPAADRATRRDVAAGADGKFRAEQPFTAISSTNCASSERALDFDPGDAGRVYAELAEGDKMFAAYGRSMHVNLNENYLEVYQFPTRDLDWTNVNARSTTITVTRRAGGPPIEVVTKADSGRPGRTKVTLTDSTGERVILRSGDLIRAQFDEGPITPTRAVTLDFTLPLATGSPDITTHTLAGVGPRGWNGRATLAGQSAASKPWLATLSSTAYAPVQFTNTTAALPLVQGYAGTVSFSDTRGRRVWAAWAATAYPVKIEGWPRPEDTLVCGTAQPGATVRIHDVTVDTDDLVIGTDPADTAGRFCATVGALKKNQVLLAEADGVYSQPTVISGGNRILIAQAIR
jgi:hypothetical protein